MLLVPGAGWALSSDRTQPMHIEADEVTIDDKKQVSIYKGDVVVTQGTLRITADKLTVYAHQGDVQRMVAVGRPATYRQRPDDKDQDVKAEALTMEYLADREVVILTDQAKLWQGPNTFASERIVYRLDRDQVDAGRKAGGERVRITIQPKEDDDTGGARQ
ncbi:MAG: lipopolysaccharide transport periplasmic protein LptA [Gammaproteobacteria bacterium]|nr:lipopolysaccharide transport periplasmic protein LptA [Gammaproteobacteria bacterium]NIR98811.1 lipopolysaccharide transport periplasmic protein LptA [Gammaproteobacteria bacterium]NIT64521.1 lipopolysaccharide transport periplasmic protein LptA [Gammaproteobacteria bacterium]NIV21441.1 lipopolysaccharide transport periplasmic protein LptA [Gammaproteobacteria bacterium]NIX11311.1 lipopolysaccharide transport periplasmic protein LptA [Gammaproteobacteria bacterium]